MDSGNDINSYSECGLQLNVSSEIVERKSSKKNLLHTNNLPSSPHSSQKVEPVASHEKFQKTNSHRENAKSKDCQKGQISSLFKNNPEVPLIAASELEGKKETLFSGRMFEDLSLHPHLVSCLKSRLDILKLTEVQEQTVPVLLKKNDALVKSCTGSGKTLAYAVPIVQELQEIRPKIQRSDGPYALVIVPTRELALQCFECFSTLTKAFTWIVPGYLVGGEKKKSEKARIRKGINILISTPGRLLDHLEHTTNLSVGRIKCLVIDEADKLLEQGFEEAVLKIVSHCSPSDIHQKRQTVLLSATLSKGVQHLAGMSMSNPVYIDIAASGSAFERIQDLVVPSQLQQHFVITPTKLRLVTLSSFIVDKCAQGRLKALVFMCTQNNVDYHFTLFNEMLRSILKASGHPIKFFRLHGNMKQDDRTQVFNKFRANESGVLLCTDVAARGLDLPNVDCIIQYSVPVSPESYVHRVGRTARIGNVGLSLLFLIPSEVKFIDVLMEHKIHLKEFYMKDLLVGLDVIGDVLQEESKQGFHPKNFEERATALHLKYEDMVYSEHSIHDSAREAFLSFVQAYVSFPKLLRTVVPFRLLHLGHVAKSFCLRESPSDLGCHYSNRPYQPKVKERQSSVIPKRKKMADVSEYDNGLADWKDEIPLKKKKR